MQRDVTLEILIETPNDQRYSRNTSILMYVFVSKAWKYHCNTKELWKELATKQNRKSLKWAILKSLFSGHNHFYSIQSVAYLQTKRRRKTLRKQFGIRGRMKEKKQFNVLSALGLRYFVAQSQIYRVFGIVNEVRSIFF